ncbi:MAG TPA: NTP pyrophosphohydrolase [Dysgonomonas sp.]|nr:NTP pyrophosphohydrolase [Dysgonomonas sp.]
MNRQEEIFPLVDAEGNITGQATRSQCHDGSKLLHPVIHLHVFNSEGELFLQKRSYDKDIQPGKWDSSVGGHIDLNESPAEAVMRESREELGLLRFTPHYITKYIIETDVERELTYCYFTIYNDKISIDNSEVIDGRFWTIEEIALLLHKNVFTLNFELDFEKFLKQGLNHLLQNTK